MDDYLLVANAEKGTIVKVPVKDGELDGTIANVDIDDPDNVISGDGLNKVDDDIIIIQTGSNTILLESDDDFETAEIKKVVSCAGIDDGGVTVAALVSDDHEEIELIVTAPGWISY